ncbi:MAG: right-handed parallel beta-helix repeat-containing protein [Kiritimatiellaeota bacterium]|nr:right-handed parallel beta-helix repeat-containing protein [Kiritimatiellota bacterium]
MLIGLGLTMVLTVPWASAVDRYVAPNGTGGGTSWTDTHSNLIEMVALAGNNDTVYVTNNATYWLTNQITIANSITVRSWGPGGIYDPTNTILSGRYPNAINRHFTLNNAGATVAGLTLTKGYESAGGSIYLQNGMVTNCIIVSNVAYSSSGGGVYMLTGAGGVWNCTISGNIVSNVGMSAGGIYVASGGPWRIANCTISGNSCTNGSGSGGGIRADVTTIISNCWIVSNQAGYAGGGIYLGGGGCYNSFIIGNKVVSSPSSFGGGVRLTWTSLLRNCLIVNNSAMASSASAGGVYINENISIQNCTIASNVSSGSGGVYFMGTGGNAGFPKVENTIIWGNASGGSYSNWSSGASDSSISWVTFTNCCIAPNIYSNANSFASGINTITNDPRFVNNATDFRLQPSSPCINAGVNRGWMEGALDLYGYRRIDNFRKTVDIGAYEYLSAGTMFSGH